MGTLWICQRTKTKRALWCLLLVAPIYFALRIPNLWTGDNLVELVRSTATAMSTCPVRLGIECIFQNVMFIRKAALDAIFGWDGWGRTCFVADESGYRPGIDAL